jgi:phage replication O-like protein O
MVNNTKDINANQDRNFTQIPNKIMEALWRIKLTPTATNILYIIIRFTYGYNRKSHNIPNKIFQELTGIKKPNITRAIKSLEKQNIIIVIRENRANVFYSINEDVNNWKHEDLLSEMTTTVIPTDNKLLSKSITTEAENDNDLLSKSITTVIENDNKLLSKTITTVIENDNNSFLYKKEKLNKEKENLYKEKKEFAIAHSKKEETKSLSTKVLKKDSDYEKYLEAWNSAGLSSQVRILTPERKRNIDKLEAQDKDFFTHFKICIQKIKESDFLSGRQKNSTWRASFDWLFAKNKGGVANYIRALEDVFKNKTDDAISKLKEWIDE